MNKYVQNTEHDEVILNLSQRYTEMQTLLECQKGGEGGGGERRKTRRSVAEMASTGSLIPTVRRGGIPASLLEVSPTVTKLSLDTAER